MEVLNEKDKTNNTVGESDFMKYAQDIIKANIGKFVVKRKTEFENLIKKPIYTKATIRVKFPDEMLLQGNFALMETIGDINCFIKEHLNDPSQEFYLNTSFPRKTFSDLNSTVHSLNLAPSSVINISFKNIDPRTAHGYQYLRDESIERFKSELN